ncbi:hypothetical protein BDQ17DRAFT_1373308 [Cyathus striatus]|nr:hypothetical protein BDQ17DRAFT_1373308 [Cyathus striatus]
MDNPAYSGRTGPFHGANHFTVHQAYMAESMSIEKAGDKQIAHSAMHNSGERYDVPKCHPGTRDKVLDEIVSWINNPNQDPRTMWLHGPAGAGKSEDKLAASFFFSRHNSDRNTCRSLVATIVYQLALYVTDFKRHLADALQNNGSAIWSMSLEWQIQKLITEPLMKVVHKYPTIAGKCLIIDGLDECVEYNMQKEVVSLLSVLIVSRPDLYIRQEFKQAPTGSFIPFNLNEKDKFNDIKLHHPLRHGMNSNWPSNEELEQIVNRSSKQFIYAATVLRFVENPRSNPRKSLERVTNINSIGTNNPFAELDNFYLSILYNATRDNEVYQKLLLIFEALLFFRGVKVPQLLDDFLHMGGDIMSILIDVHSILKIPENPARNEITFYHASFTEFLRDSRRSGKFFIDEALAHLHLSEYCVKCLKEYLDNDTPRNERPRTFDPSIRGYFHYLNRSLLLNPQIFSDDNYMAKDGIATVCRATIETRYAKIGFKIQFGEYLISGIIFGRSTYREYNKEVKISVYDWAFEEMDHQFQDSRFFTIGMYSERGAGLWNHLTIKDDASLKVVQAQVLTSLLEIDRNSIDFDLRRYTNNSDYTNYNRLIRTSFIPHWRDRRECVNVLRLLLEWLTETPELKIPVVNLRVALQFILGKEVVFGDGALDDVKALIRCVETLLNGGLELGHLSGYGINLGHSGRRYS